MADTREPCHQNTNGYANHKKVTVSKHPAFRDLCLPVHKDILLFAGDDIKAYFSLVGFQHNKEYFEVNSLTSKNTQPNNEYDNYRKRSEGKKRSYINATIPHNDVFSRIMLHFLPRVLFNNEYYFKYFCHSHCKPDTKRHPARWGGTASDEFKRNRLFKDFLTNVLPEIKQANTPIDTKYFYIVPNGRGNFDFLTNKLDVSLSFYAAGVYKPKNESELLKATAIYDNKSLYDKNIITPETGSMRRPDRGPSTYPISMTEQLAEKIYLNKGMRCVTKIKVLDWVFSDNSVSTPKGKMFMPVWESASDQIDCFSNNSFEELYFSFNWRTKTRI